MENRKITFYEKYIKRFFDFICSLLFIIVFFWLYLFIAIIVKIKMGSPVVFKQPRPGIIKNGTETIFYMYKFRSMTNEKDANGNLLPDEQRLPAFGKLLRATSLDELPELFNILKGEMSFIGPRPFLVRDMVFMSDEIHMRHTARPGLSGLAQVNGRNAISWEKKFEWDLKYIEKVTFASDFKILLKTIFKVFGRTENSEELDVTLDYGDALLQSGKITQKEYKTKQQEAIIILK